METFVITAGMTYAQFETANAGLIASAIGNVADMDIAISDVHKTTLEEALELREQANNGVLSAMRQIPFGELSPENRLAIHTANVLRGDVAIKRAKADNEIEVMFHIDELSSKPFNSAREGNSRNVKGGFAKFFDCVDENGETPIYHAKLCSTNGRFFSEARYPYLTDLNGAKYCTSRINLELEGTGVRRYGALQYFLDSIFGKNEEGVVRSGDLVSKATQLWIQNKVSVSGIDGKTDVLVVKVPKGSEPFDVNMKNVQPIGAEKLAKVVRLFKAREEAKNKQLDLLLDVQVAEATKATSAKKAAIERELDKAAIQDYMTSFNLSFAEARAAVMEDKRLNAELQTA